MSPRRSAVTLMAAGIGLAAVAALADPSSAAPRVVVTGRSHAGKRLSVPDPALPLRPSRAALALLPPAADGTLTGGSVRVTINPVTGQVCTVGSGIGTVLTGGPGAVAPAGPTGLALVEPDGSRVLLTDATLSGCVFLNPVEAVDALVHTGAYQVVIFSAAGDEAGAALAPAAAQGRPWAVGTRTEAIVDGTRGTPRRGRMRATHSRILRVTYYYPAAGPTDGTAVLPSSEGPFPVVMFSPGYAVTPQTYVRTLHAWAAAGYVVAGVLSPGSGGGLPGIPTEADLGTQPRDLSVVLTAIARRAASAVSWLGGLVDLSRVAVTGHSDGGSTAAAAGLLRAYADPRYDAVIVMAGADLGGAKAPKALPLLVLSGQRDEYNSPATFRHVFMLGRATRTWVQAVGAHHLPPFTVAGAQADDLRALEIAFLDRSLFGADTRNVENGLASIKGVTRVAAGTF